MKNWIQIIRLTIRIRWLKYERTFQPYYSKNRDIVILVKEAYDYIIFNEKRKLVKLLRNKH